MHMSDFSADCMKKLLFYAYDNLDAFKLILLCSEGTRFSGMADEMTEIESKGTYDFFDTLATNNSLASKINPKLEHILITGMFNAYFEIIVHEMPPDDALIYINQLHDFYLAGWQKIMGQA